MICSKFGIMAKAKFYLRSKGADCNIYLRYNYSATEKMQVSTGLKIHSDDFSSATGLPKSKDKDSREFSANLKDLIVSIDREYNLDFTQGVRFNNDWLKSKINKFFDRPDENTKEKLDDNLFLVYLDNYIEFRNLKGDTKRVTERKFHQLKTKFTKFEKKKRKKYLISEIDSHFILNFKRFMMDELKNMESTANDSVRKLKTVLLNARDEHDKTTHKSINKIKIKTIEAVKVFLSFDEIEKIKETHIIGTELQHAKDWLIIGLNTGQRVSDLLRMTKEMIYTVTDSSGESFELIRLTQEKTGSKVSLPINDEVKTILNKYDGNFPPTFGQKGDSKFVLFNRYIKKVCELSGITNIVKGRVFNEETKRNEIAETEKYKLVSSHICRRSFATNYYGDNRFTTAELMSITGHKTETVFLNYIGKTAEEHALKSAKTFRTIAEEKKKSII